jgi:hypothetical protein
MSKSWKTHFGIVMALKFNVILVWKKHYMEHNTREFAKIDD